MCGAAFRGSYIFAKGFFKQKTSWYIDLKVKAKVFWSQCLLLSVFFLNGWELENILVSLKQRYFLKFFLVLYLHMATWLSETLPIES